MMEKNIMLNQRNLKVIADHIHCPDYKRDELKKGIVHIGVGGFHRAHQALYTHNLLNGFKSTEWGICGVGIREDDRKIYEILRSQDGLYTLIVKHPDGKIEVQIIGSLIDFMLGVDNPKPVIARMAHPDTKIVSLTITEGGYNFNPATGEFDFDNPDIQYELGHSDSPKTVYGYLTAALKKRRDDGLPAFTIMSCDNMEHNGDVTRNMLLSFAKKQDFELAEWIEKEVCFPNSMVDRITPVTSQEDKDYLKRALHMVDNWPVTCEPFIQWVIEDKFSTGRPEFEKVGVQFVPDVKPYEKMKLRLLNAGHSVLGILGAIYGYKTINACMEDQVFISYLRAFMDQEATPVLDEVKGIDLTEYKDGLEERFANPNIRDSVSRICSESSAKIPKFLISTLLDNLERKGSIKYTTMVLATWCYYSDKRVDRNEQPLEIIDAMSGTLHQAAKLTRTNSLAFLKLESIFGDLSKNKRFTMLFSEMVQKIYEEANVKKLMQQLL